MFKVKDEIKIPFKNISNNILANGNELTLIDNEGTFIYTNNKWYLSNEYVNNMFMGYGFKPNFSLETKIEKEGFDDIFEEIKE